MDEQEIHNFELPIAKSPNGKRIIVGYSQFLSSWEVIVETSRLGL